MVVGEVQFHDCIYRPPAQLQHVSGERTRGLCSAGSSTASVRASQRSHFKAGAVLHYGVAMGLCLSLPGARRSHHDLCFVHVSSPRANIPRHGVLRFRGRKSKQPQHIVSEDAAPARSVCFALPCVPQAPTAIQVDLQFRRQRALPSENAVQQLASCVLPVALSSVLPALT